MTFRELRDDLADLFWMVAPMALLTSPLWLFALGLWLAGADAATGGAR